MGSRVMRRKIYGTYHCVEISLHGYNLAKECVVNAWVGERVHRNEIDSIKWIHKITNLHFAVLPVRQMIMWWEGNWFT